MEDLTALAERLSAGVGDARGVLILSRDGLVLGAHPADAEGMLKHPWVRFASVGEPERGFLQFGTETWSFVRRGPYAAFVVSGPGVRPGLVIDQIEVALLAAEEARTRREELRPEPPAPAQAPSGKPRTPLHPEPRPLERAPVVIHADDAAPVEIRAMHGDAEDPAAPGPTVPDDATGRAADGPPDASAAPSPEPPSAGDAPGPPGSVWGGSTEPAAGEEEIDRFSLAREFSKLLQEPEGRADG